MAAKKRIKFPAIEVHQPIGDFYIGAIGAADLVAISFADVRRIEARDVERVVGIERPLEPDRVAELQRYVRTVDATFPTSVILALSGEDATYEPKSRTMSLTRENNVAQIIDGQHRIAGLEKYDGDDFQINVVIFVDMDLEDKGNVFATINLKQTKVSKSLAYDLFEYAKTRSPQKTCHNIAKLLNREAGGPLERRIKILGRATGEEHELLTQAAFVDRLLPHISADPMSDRDTLKRGKKLKPIDEQQAKRYIFRNAFIAEDDALIAKNVSNYFSAVAERWPTAWGSTRRGDILPRTQGFAGLMRFLGEAYNSFGRPGGVITQARFTSLFKKVKLKDDQFTSDRYLPGSTGEKKLLDDLRTSLK